MPLFVSASKAARALLSRTNCERHWMRLTQRSNHNERHWTRSLHRSNHFERYVQARSSSNFAGFKTSCMEDLNYNDSEGNHLLRDMHKYVQARGFLGCGDGEEGSVLSKTYEEKLVLGYSPEQLYAVVAAVDMYEDFLPWCQRSKIVRHNPDGSFDAELEIGFKFFVESYISHVELTKNKSIKTTASESNLFDHLINIWQFQPGPVPGSCNVYFLVDFKFQSPLYRQVASMFFKEVVSRLVESFNDRCRLIYGPGVPVIENSYGEQSR